MSRLRDTTRSTPPFLPAPSNRNGDVGQNDSYALKKMRMHVPRNTRGSFESTLPAPSMWAGSKLLDTHASAARDVAEAALLTEDCSSLKRADVALQTVLLRANRVRLHKPMHDQREDNTRMRTTAPPLFGLLLGLPLLAPPLRRSVSR